MTVRLESAEDLTGLAQIHLRCWRETYSGTEVPTDFEKGAVQKLREHFENCLSQGDQIERGLSDQNQLIGYSHFSKEPSAETKQWLSVQRANQFADIESSGELQAIYFLREFQGRGLGSDFVKRGLVWQNSKGLSRTYVWVIQSNQNAKRFYESRGAKPIGERLIQLGEKSITELLFYWDLRQT